MEHEIWNIAPVVCIASTGLSPLSSEVTNISDIIHSFDNEKSSSISQLINSKSRNFQKLLIHFNGIATSVANALLLSSVLPIIFVLYSND